MIRRGAGAAILAPLAAIAQDLKPIDVPTPRNEGGQALTTTLRLRRSTREYSDRPIPVQTLSDLLWTAFWS
jgi:hypothetical protein